MKTLSTPADRVEILSRIEQLTPISMRQWGTMTVSQMICHLHDSYLVPLGERSTEPVKVPIPRSVMKVLALRISRPWPRNVQTVEEVRQGGGGTPPIDFTADKARLLHSVERFCASTNAGEIQHAFFGKMSHADWMRWGYLHADHHLRQFNA